MTRTYRFIKPINGLFILVSLLLLGACQSEPDTIVPPPGLPSVTINKQAYLTKAFGKQTWTLENYAGPGGKPYGTGTDKAVYGRFYTIDEARAIVVPAGWRLPTIEDWVALAESQGIVLTNYRASGQEAIRKLLSKTNWRTTSGTNDSGFNAYPTGYISQNIPPEEGSVAEFWLTDGKSMSIQESDGKHNLSFYVNSHDPTAHFTIRFVKDN